MKLVISVLFIFLSVLDFSFAKEILEPPYIVSVKHYPENPKENQLIKITTKVKPFSKESGKLKSYLYYLIEGEKDYEMVEMKENKQNILSAKIGIFKKGTKINYFVMVKDENNYKTLEIPTQNYISENEFYKDKLPMFSPFAQDEDEQDNEGKKLLPELDIKKFAMAYGEKEGKKYLYGVLKMKGEVKEGTTSPLRINTVAISLQNPDIDIDSTSKAIISNPYKIEVPHKGGIGIMWAPLFHMISDLSEYPEYVEHDINGQCFGMSNRLTDIGTIFFPNVSCSYNENYLYWITYYSSLDENPSKNYFAFISTGIIKTIDNKNIDDCYKNDNLNKCFNLIDQTTLTRFYLTPPNRKIIIN